MAPPRVFRCYLNNMLDLTRGYVNSFLKLRKVAPTLEMGMAGLIAARTGGIRLGLRAAAAKLIDAKYRTICPCCEGIWSLTAIAGTASVTSIWASSPTTFNFLVANRSLLCSLVALSNMTQRPPSPWQTTLLAVVRLSTWL